MPSPTPATYLAAALTVAGFAAVAGAALWSLWQAVCVAMGGAPPHE